MWESLRITANHFERDFLSGQEEKTISQVFVHSRDRKDLWVSKRHREIQREEKSWQMTCRRTASARGGGFGSFLHNKEEERGKDRNEITLWLFLPSPNITIRRITFCVRCWFSPPVSSLDSCLERRERIGELNRVEYACLSFLFDKKSSNRASTFLSLSSSPHPLNPCSLS